MSAAQTDVEQPADELSEDEEFADLDVIVSCTRAIDTLDDITRDRVVRWLHAHYVEQSR